MTTKYEFVVYADDVPMYVCRAMIICRTAKLKSAESPYARFTYVIYTLV